MGYLGFLFNVEKDSNTIKLLEKKIENSIVIFIDLRNIKGNYIVGDKKFIQEEVDFFYLNNDLKLNDFLVFEKSNFKFGKIATNDRTIVDFEHLTFWFKGQDSRLIREALFLEKSIDNLEIEVINRVKFLINFFVYSQNFK